MDSTKDDTREGPFEISFSEDCSDSATEAMQSQTAYCRAVFSDPLPGRRLNCENYETCLGLAAALNWESFTCQGCCGSVNEQLIWRAARSSRKDSIVNRLGIRLQLTRSIRRLSS